MIFFPNLFYMLWASTIASLHIFAHDPKIKGMSIYNSVLVNSQTMSLSYGMVTFKIFKFVILAILIVSSQMQYSLNNENHKSQNIIIMLSINWP